MQVEGYRDSKQGFGGGAPRHSLPCCVSPLGRGSDPEQRVGQVAATIKKAAETAAFLIFRGSAL